MSSFALILTIILIPSVILLFKQARQQAKLLGTLSKHTNSLESRYRDLEERLAEQGRSTIEYTARHMPTVTQNKPRRRRES
jgi:hypothetical protein